MATLDGVGIGLNARSLVRQELTSGMVVPVLEGIVEQIQPVSLLYSAGSKLSPKIRAFTEYAQGWVEQMGTEMTGPDLPSSRPTLVDDVAA